MNIKEKSNTDGRRKEGTVKGSAQPISEIKVLLLENKIPNLLISHYLKLWQLDFDSAPNSQTAVEMVATNEYDLVLMDIDVTISDSLGAARRIRQLPNEKASQIPIIAFSASPKDVEELKSVHIDTLISKPLHATELYDAIQLYKGLPPSDDTTFPSPEIPLDMSEITEIFEGDEKALSDFFVAVVEDLRDVSEDFTKAAANKNLQAFRDAVHKTQSFLRIFQPAVFLNFLEKTGKVYEEEEWEKLPEANGEIIETINRMLIFLKRQI